MIELGIATAAMSVARDFRRNIQMISAANTPAISVTRFISKCSWAIAPNARISETGTIRSVRPVGTERNTHTISAAKREPRNKCSLTAPTAALM